MADSDKRGFDADLVYLESQLNIPGASLTRQWLDEEVLALWLLNIDEGISLEASAIGQLWQQMPYWAFAWAGGRSLARYIVQNPDLVMGKRILDFGCGSGIAGIAAGLSGAREVGMVDLDPNALAIAQINAALNGVQVQSAGLEDAGDYDLLLAADVLYDVSSHEDLQEYISLVPDYLFAESKALERGPSIEVSCLDQLRVSTTPRIGDFDEEVSINIYGRPQKKHQLN